MAKQIIILGLFVVFFGALCNATVERTVQVFVNPGCELTECSIVDPTATPAANISFSNLVHVRAQGSQDVVHYLWSSVDTFSLLFAVTNLDSNLTVNWTQLLDSSNTSGAIVFDPPPTYAAAVVFTNLYYYDDPDDKVLVGNPGIKVVEAVSFHNFSWEAVQVTNSSSQQASAIFRSSSDVGNVFGELLQFNLHAYGYEDHAGDLPSLLHTANSFQLEMILDHFHDSLEPNLRFAFEMAVLSQESEQDDGFQLNTHKTIDDEYTPGVFTTVELTSGNSRAGNNNGTYLQWKPVTYTSTSRTTEESTVTQQVLQQHSNDTQLLPALANSLAYAYFGESIYQTPVAWMNISYGLAGDGYYKDYLSWTVTIGTGKPPEESFSTMVIAIIIVGFGVPAILIIAGGIIILVRRCRPKKDDLNYSSDRLVDSEH